MQRDERGFLACQGMSKEEQPRLRASFTRTVLFRAVQARPKREKGPASTQELHTVPALRVAFGVQVLNAQAKAAKTAKSASESHGTSAQAGLFVS